MSKIEPATIHNDAGELREYLARTYGRVFVYGGAAHEWGRAYAHAGRLARMIGQTREWVINQAREDFRDLEDGVMQ